LVGPMTCRTPPESAGLTTDSGYGPAASVWTESVNLAPAIAPPIKAGTVWVNCTNQFDAASGFGGYRESGFGREGGREGLWEYIRPKWEATAPVDEGSEHEARPVAGPVSGEGRVAGAGVGGAADSVGPAAAGVGADSVAGTRPAAAGLPAIDRTAKLFIGGKQVRP